MGVVGIVFVVSSDVIYLFIGLTDNGAWKGTLCSSGGELWVRIGAGSTIVDKKILMFLLF